MVEVIETTVSPLTIGTMRPHNMEKGENHTGLARIVPRFITARVAREPPKVARVQKKGGKGISTQGRMMGKAVARVLDPLVTMARVMVVLSRDAKRWAMGPGSFLAGKPMPKRTF